MKSSPVDAEDQRPVTSSLFAADLLKEQGKPTFRSVPDLKIDQQDPARALIETALALSSVEEQSELYHQAIQQFPKSAEARLRLAGLCPPGNYRDAETLIAECVSKYSFDFRNVWMRVACCLRRIGSMVTVAHTHASTLSTAK